MCFSLQASFAASALLFCIGTIALYKTRKKNCYLFAAIPIFFGIQQINEGFLWFFIDRNDQFSTIMTSISTYFFLFCAFIVWPIWIPLSIILMEKKSPRKKLLAIPLIIGIAIGLLLLSHLIYFGARAYNMHHHIVYDIYIPQSLWLIGTIGYLIATIMPFFCTARSDMVVLGTLLGLSYWISFYYYYQALISVWCFFVALISLGILFIV